MPKNQITLPDLIAGADDIRDQFINRAEAHLMREENEKNAAYLEASRRLKKALKQIRLARALVSPLNDYLA